MTQNLITISPSLCRSHSCMVEQLQPLIKLKKGDSATLVINLYGFLYPNYLTLINCAISEAQARSVNTTLKIIHGSGSSYASRVNFLNNLDVEYNELYHRHDPTGRFLEITNFDKSSGYKLVDQLSDILTNSHSIEISIQQALNLALGEITDNVLIHSGSATNGWMSAQYYVNRQIIKIIVADGGIGIQAALNKNPTYAHWSGKRALRDCTIQGVTSNGMGNGLFITSEFIALNGGMLLIHSGNYKRVINKYSDRILSSPHWPGTFVYMEIKTNTGIDLEGFIEHLSSNSNRDFANLKSTFEVFLENHGLDKEDLW